MSRRAKRRRVNIADGLGVGGCGVRGVRLCQVHALYQGPNDIKVSLLGKNG